MVLEMPVEGLPFGRRAARPETIMEGRHRIEFTMEALHFTKRRVSGSISIDAPAMAIWDAITAYELQPSVIPSILSQEVSRQPDGQVFIEQVSLLSSKLNLRAQMRIQAIEHPERLQLVLRRVSGHGFLQFDCKYVLKPQSGSRTVLQYSVELMPCPIFPMPLVDQKIRRQVPKMLVALNDLSVRLARRAEVVARPQIGG